MRTVKGSEILDELTDITGPGIVEIQVRADGKVVWVNVDGICRLRCCQIKQLKLDDERPKEEHESKDQNLT